MTFKMTRILPPTPKVPQNLRGKFHVFSSFERFLSDAHQSEEVDFGFREHVVVSLRETECLELAPEVAQAVKVGELAWLGLLASEEHPQGQA